MRVHIRVLQAAARPTELCRDHSGHRRPPSASSSSFLPPTAPYTLPPQSIVASYRLAILRYSTTSITSTAPGSLNASSSKIAFYLLHVVPEFTAAAILVCTNVRRTFATGDHGDRKGKDPKLGPDGKPVPKSGKGWWARLTSWRWK